MDSQVEEFGHELTRIRDFIGEFRTDSVSKVLYSTDASIYQIKPLGVLIPGKSEDLAIAMEVAAKIKIPLILRGSGSSLAGQPIGEGVIIDCSKHLNRCLEFNEAEKFAIVEPGLILSTFNRMISAKGLQFGPDPASAERATLGGCIANNAAGAHSIIYGMTVDHVLALDFIFSDGSQIKLASIDLESAHSKAQSGLGLESAFYKTALQIRAQYTNAIRNNWPQTWRRVSGYNLNYLIPWSASKPPMWENQFSESLEAQVGYPPVNHGEINLANLIAGSEGTLGIIKAAKLRLVPKLDSPVLVVLPFQSIEIACDAVPELLTYEPSAIELIPQTIIKLARSVPAYASQLSFLNPLIEGSDPAAILVVEFTGEAKSKIVGTIKNFRGKYYLAESDEEQKNVWAVRKVGLGILMSSHGSTKPVAFIEDMAVPIENLSKFIQEINRLFLEFGTQAEMYAHASAGCLHIRPLLNLKEAKGLENLRAISKRAAQIAIGLGGAVSAEHGDGISRSEWLEIAYGTEITHAFKALKSALDPNNLLNPGKIVDPVQMDSNLRYDISYQTQGWEPSIKFPIPGKEGLVDAVEQCNGAGVCRKNDSIMCPSFQVTREEMHSTRGRANLLRTYISFQKNGENIRDIDVKEALDLCLACKGCKAECPSAVDMAKLKYEFLNHYYQSPGRRHPVRDYLFGYIHVFGRIGINIRPIANAILASRWFIGAADHWLGITKHRSLPKLAKKSLNQQLGCNFSVGKDNSKKILLLTDAFGQYFHTEATYAAIQVLKAYGFNPEALSTIGAGRTLISKGFLESAKQHAKRLIKEINRLDPQGIFPIIGIEPSEIYTLRDEYLDLIPSFPDVQGIARRSWTIEEFLIRSNTHSDITSDQELIKSTRTQEILFHAHCYQRAMSAPGDGFPYGAVASISLLRDYGFKVELVDDGCCGVAGAFGYEKEHYSLSVKVGELFLIPALQLKFKENPGVQFSASGVSCQAQIEHKGYRKAYHPIEFVYHTLGKRDYASPLTIASNTPPAITLPN